MENYLIKFVIITLCANLAWSLPTKLHQSDDNAIGDLKLHNNLHNVTVEAILKKIVSPLDTDAQKEAKKLIAQYLVGLVAQLNSTGPSKSSKSERYHVNPIENDKIKETIVAALIAAKNEEIGDANSLRSLRTGKQLISGATNSTQLPSVTEQPAPSLGPKPISSNELTTQQPVESKPTNSIDKHQTMILAQVNDLVTNVQKGNVSGVVDNGLKVASLETIGVVLNNFLNIVLCNPLDRVRGTCQATV